MASPHVAGALAVLLQFRPGLDSVQARSFLMEGGRGDAFTGAVPNQLFGAGKMDLLESAGALLKLVTNVEMDAAGSMTWSPEPHSESYNVYRGGLPGSLPASYGTCVASALNTPVYDDPNIPAPGSGSFYLATGLKDGIEGSLGFDSALVQRINGSPCP
jgi:hypothetical protein